MSCKITLLIMFFIIVSPVISQENGSLQINPETAHPADARQPEISANSDIIYIINSFNFSIDGFTRPYALIYNGNLIKGEEISGSENLENYIQDKTQILMNHRVLESVKIDYVIGQAQKDGKQPVDLFFTVKDTWNMVAIPRPKYSSNSGFDITLKARDYNFLGTMSPLRVDLGYIYNENGEHFVLFMLDSDIPFRLFNLDWNFNFDNSFDYRPDLEQPFYYKNTTGLSVEVPVSNTTITAGFNESLILNEENYDGASDAYGNFQDGLYLSSIPYFSWRIPTGLNMGVWGELVYTAGFSATINHEIPKWPLADFRIGPFLSFSQNLGFGRIDWIGNFLKGYNLSVYNSFSFNIYSYKNDAQPWGSYLNITGISHFVFDDMFGISARLVYRQWFFTDTGAGGAGDVMRGILDKDITAVYIFSANIDLPVKALKFKPSDWLNNSKLRLFNFDLHVIPIFDIALYMNPANEIDFTGADFTYKNMLVTSGLELIVFPEFFRSLFLRISLGINLSTFISDSRYELFIGTDLHY